MRKLVVVSFCLYMFLDSFSFGEQGGVISPLSEATSTQSISTNLKIGVVDMKKAFDEYEVTKTTIKKLKEEIAAKSDEASAKEKEILALRNTYIQQASLMSEEAKKAKEKEIAMKTEEYRKYYGEVSQNLIEKERKLTDDIINDIYNIVKIIAKENKYDLVFDRKSLLVGGEDITDKVIKKLNEKK